MQPACNDTDSLAYTPAYYILNWQMFSWLYSLHSTPTHKPGPIPASSCIRVEIVLCVGQSLNEELYTKFRDACKQNCTMYGDDLCPSQRQSLAEDMQLAAVEGERYVPHWRGKEQIVGICLYMYSTPAKKRCRKKRKEVSNTPNTQMHTSK